MPVSTSPLAVGAAVYPVFMPLILSMFADDPPLAPDCVESSMTEDPLDSSQARLIIGDCGGDGLPVLDGPKRNFRRDEGN